MNGESPRRQTARTLAFLSGVLLLVGASVMAPEAALLALGLAVVAALPALAWGSRTVRVVTALLVLAALALIVSLYPRVAGT